MNWESKSPSPVSRLSDERLGEIREHLGANKRIEVSAIERCIAAESICLAFLKFKGVGA